jgi:hypothetical protein
VNTLSVTGIITSYLIIAVLLINMVIYSKWSLKVKTVGCIITAVFFLVSIMSFPPLFGWATSENLPVRFRLISAYVQQPDKLSGDEGTIYIWLTKLDDLTTVQVPRNHKLPYSNVLHEKIINANAKLDKGIAQLGEFEDKQDFAMIGKDGSNIELNSNQIQFYDLPDPLFPDK